MAVSILTEPDALLPAYTPVKFTLKTDRLPNTIAGESGINVITIGLATTPQLSAFPALRSTDLVVTHFAVASGTFAVGQTVLIQGSNLGRYDGRHTVIKEIDDNHIVIDTANAGASTGGTIGKYYDGLAIFALVTLANDGMDAFAATEPHRLTPNSAGVIEFDVRSLLQRAMDLTVETPSIAGQVVRTKSFVRYTVKFYEGYIEPVAGVPVFTADDTVFVEAREQTAVMANQPFIHARAGQAYVYTDMLAPFKLLTTPDARFLTHRPRGPIISVGRTEHARLDFLVGKTIGYTADLRIRVVAYNATTLLATNVIPFTAQGQTTYYATIGPANLDTTLLPLAATSYVVTVESLVAPISEAFTFRVDPRLCEGPQYTVYWRNRLGGMDWFHFGGPMTVGGSSESVVTQQDEIDPQVTENALRTVRSRTSQQVFTILTDYVTPEVQQWLATELCQSMQAMIIEPLADVPRFTPIIIEDGEAQGYGVSGGRARFALNYRLANEVPHQIR